MPAKLRLVLALIILYPAIAQGGKFAASYPCQDGAKTCELSGQQVVDGFTVKRDCWQWSYRKVCNYPSKNDCQNFNHCYLVADRDCLLKDSMGNCVNLQREFSCKDWQPITVDKETASTSIIEREGKEQMICKAAYCIDGNCIDKSYVVDGDMMESVTKLYAISQLKGAKDMNFKLFEGFAQSCSKKATSYTNCCSISLKGWGNNLGARCTKDEQDLLSRRQQNLCVYVGKENKQTLGITAVVKHHYCCFGSLLDKIIQVEGRKQLGLNFGTASMPDCGGLTLAEIMRLDFEKMDFSEFYACVLKRMKIPKTSDISTRVNSSLPNIKQYDGNQNNQKNNMSGWQVKDDNSR